MRATAAASRARCRPRVPRHGPGTRRRDPLPHGRRVARSGRRRGRGSLQDRPDAAAAALEPRSGGPGSAVARGSGGGSDWPCACRRAPPPGVPAAGAGGRPSRRQPSWCRGHGGAACSWCCPPSSGRDCNAVDDDGDGFPTARRGRGRERGSPVRPWAAARRPQRAGRPADALPGRAGLAVRPHHRPRAGAGSRPRHRGHGRRAVRRRRDLAHRPAANSRCATTWTAAANVASFGTDAFRRMVGLAAEQLVDPTASPSA